MSKDISQPPDDNASRSPKVIVELSKIASNPKNSKILIFIFLVASCFLGYKMLNQEKKVDPFAQKQTIVQEPKKVFTPVHDESYTQDIAPPELAMKSLNNISKSIDDQKNDIILPTLPNDQNNTKSADTSKVQDASAKTTNISANLNDMPPPIPVSTATQETLALPSAGIGVNAQLPNSTTSDDSKDKKKRIQSSMMLIGGSSSTSASSSASSTSTTTTTDYATRQFTDRTLGRGKLIDAVIENSINTNVLGDVRAVITRDVYAETGKNILIPKGSRVHGTSSSTTVGAYARVNITWDRVDLPTGYTITIASKGVDDLGRLGTEGRLDSKVKEQLGSVVLSSAISITLAGFLDKLSQSSSTLVYEGPTVIYAVNTVYNDASITTDAAKITKMCSAALAAITNTGDTLYSQISAACAAPSTVASTVYNQLIGYASAASTTATSSTSASSSTQTTTAITNAMTSLSDSLQTILQQNSQTPTVTLDQGSKIKIYVNKDYVFPIKAIHGAKLIE
ncbi:MAG: TrbI/VirB10 family protein [Rickettsiaceae bacterium]|nr:TrbI/VirB10 family protein [Rickettsiaceae bacterium]